MKQMYDKILLQDLAVKHLYTKVNSQRIHCVVAGEGRPVLLIPGWPQTWYTWRYVMQTLATEGFQTIAVDPPGIGDSDKPSGGYDTGSIASLLHEMMTQLGIHTTNCSATISVCGLAMPWRVISHRPSSDWY